MALVVFLKGVNVGGHRTFRPSLLAQALKRFRVVNVGAAGTFVIPAAVGRTTLRAEMLRRLPFEADLIVCDGRDILRLVSGNPFGSRPSEPGVVRFVSVLARRRPPPARMPVTMPADGAWCLRILACEGRFVLGLYRREMRAIGYLGRLEQIFGVPVTTRNWNTILTIGRILKGLDAL
ncbi:MAG TPA: hypothetical protein VFV95_04625 [Vicinamibacterales bacterium]|nr:hypothetical protein [Vicinamibacterales bacterium]